MIERPIPSEVDNYDVPKCPICGGETWKFYKTWDGEIIGCDNCIREVDADDEEE